MSGISRVFVVIVLGIISCIPSSQRVLAASSDVSLYVGDTILQVDGKTSPHAFVTISNSNGPIGTTSSDVYGKYSHTIAALSPGIHNIRIYARDNSGKTTDVITKTVSLAPGVTTTLDAFLPPTFTINKQDFLADEDLSLSGQTYPYSTVNIRINTSRLHTVGADAQGMWSFAVNAGTFGSGDHELFAMSVDGIGNQSHITSTYAFTVYQSTEQSIESAPSRRFRLPGRLQRPLPVVTIPSIRYPVSGDTVSGPIVPILGTAPKNSFIEIWDSNVQLGSVWSDQNGNWIFELSATYESYDIQIRACMNSECSEFSESVKFSVVKDSLPLHGLHIELETYHFNIKPGEQIRLHLTALRGQPPYTYKVVWGDAESVQSTTTKTVFDLTHTYHQTGSMSGKIVITDASGAQSIKYFTVAVISNNDQIWQKQFWIIVFTLIILSIVALRYWSTKSTVVPAKRVRK